jgi:hypothetical protein
MRCSVGAAGVGVVQIVINGVGAGFAFLGFAVVTAGASPLLALEWFYGEGWRWERREKLKAEEEMKIGNVENAEVVTGK